MKTILFLSALALLLAFAISYFQYYYKAKSVRKKVTLILFLLRGLSIFLILLLLINPKLDIVETQNEKPLLSILVDDSKSISYFDENENVNEIVSRITTNKKLQDKFTIQQFGFGTDISLKDSLSFSATNTNISNAIEGVQKLNNTKIAPIILISDGNQTVGKDYEFINLQQSIYPISIGDTVSYTDLKISQINANRYSFIENKFPVEVLLTYDGKTSVNTQFTIQQNNNVVFRKPISFSPAKNSMTIETNLTASKEGVQFYKATIEKVNGEKNTENNQKTFSVEVINEQTKVLLLSSILHPDLGVLKKAIEANKKNSVVIKKIDDFDNNFIDYQLVILYQPTNQFEKAITSITENNLNYFLVSGTSTDWNFINSKKLGYFKSALDESEAYSAIYNNQFLTFMQDDLGFDNLPPLNDKFGRITLENNLETLLYQRINGVETQQPLLSTFSNENQKVGLLFGEGIWKWRAASFLNTNSFSDFDAFIGNLVQYLASTKKRNRLEVNVESLYNANETINISAFYTDKNYQFDDRANLEITLINTQTNTQKKLPFSLANNSYQLEVNNLLPGDYTYKVSVLGQNIQKSGSFKITDYEVEEQFTNANTKKLQQLALKSNTSLYYQNDIDALIEELTNNKAYYTIQKQLKKEKELIEWKWLLFAILSLLTIEWFIRKYFGQI